MDLGAPAFFEVSLDSLRSPESTKTVLLLSSRLFVSAWRDGHPTSDIRVTYGLDENPDVV